MTSPLYGIPQVPPPNAPQGLGNQVGVQAGVQSPVVIATVVIIVPGTSGGLFVYYPAPGPGNLLLAIAAQAGTDPVSGQAYARGLTLYNEPQEPNASFSMYTGNATEQEHSWIFPYVSGSSPSERIASAWIGPQSTGGVNALAAVGLFSAAADGSELANGTLIAYNLSGTEIIQAIWDYTGFYLGGIEGNPLTAIIQPSRDSTGVTDTSNISRAIGNGWPVRLLAGTYYLNGTITGHEGQYVSGAGRQATIVQMTSGFYGPAFQWTPADTSTYSQTGTGGITGVSILGPGGSDNPSDGSIGVQIGDIVQLEIDVYVQYCQYGLLAENQYFQTEQAKVRVHSQGCTNPVIRQCASSGGSSRTGSFDRGEWELFTNDTISSSTIAAFQDLAGAQQVGGSLNIQGNLSADSGAAGGYVYLQSGSTPSGVSPVSASSLVGVRFDMCAEADGSGGTAPAAISVGSGCYVTQCYGAIYLTSLNTSTVTGEFNYTGPIDGDNVLANAATVITYDAAPTGWTGNVAVTLVESRSLAFLRSSLNVPASGTITAGEVLVSGIAAPYLPAISTTFTLQVYDEASGDVTVIPCILSSSSGDLDSKVSSTVTVGASGGAILGTVVYSTGF